MQFMFYRTQPFKNKGSNDPIGVPKDGDLKDEIFIASFLAQPAQVTLTNGGKTTTFTAQAGVQLKGVPFKTGSVSMVSFDHGCDDTSDNVQNVKRGSTTIATKTGPSIVSQHSTYNANAVAV